MLRLADLRVDEPLDATRERFVPARRAQVDRRARHRRRAARRPRSSQHRGPRPAAASPRGPVLDALAATATDVSDASASVDAPHRALRGPGRLDAAAERGVRLTRSGLQRCSRRRHRRRGRAQLRGGVAASGCCSRRSFVKASSQLGAAAVFVAALGGPTGCGFERRQLRVGASPSAASGSRSAAAAQRARPKSAASLLGKGGSTVAAVVVCGAREATAVGGSSLGATPRRSATVSAARRLRARPAASVGERFERELDALASVSAPASSGATGNSLPVAGQASPPDERRPSGARGSSANGVAAAAVRRPVRRTQQRRGSAGRRVRDRREIGR